MGEPTRDNDGTNDGITDLPRRKRDGIMTGSIRLMELASGQNSGIEASLTTPEDGLICSSKESTSGSQSLGPACGGKMVELICVVEEGIKGIEGER